MHFFDASAQLPESLLWLDAMLGTS